MHTISVRLAESEAQSVTGDKIPGIKRLKIKMLQKDKMF